MRMPFLFALPLLISIAPGASADVPTATSIGKIQGTGAQSPLLGQRVSVEGVVVGNFAEGLGGVFIQDARGDGDPRTSDGLFVQIQAAMPPTRGQRVRVVGRVVELGEGVSTLTALQDAAITVLGPAVLPTPVPVVAPDSPAFWESVEGMLVHVAAPLTVTGNDGLAAYGEIAVSFGGRLFAPTEVAAPGAAQALRRQDNARRALILDDNRTSKDPRNLWFLARPLDATHAMRAGSVIKGAMGVVDQRRGSYRLQLTEPLRQVTQAVRPPVPDVNGNTRIASLNVLNLFNGDGRQGGFPTARGAETLAQYQLQLKKIVASVQALKPDVAALMEIENDGTGPDSSLAQFVVALNAAGPITDYRFVDSGNGPGTNPIRVAIIYRSSRVTTLGAFATLEGGPFLEHSRVPLAQAFQRLLDGKATGKPFVIVANHFKSKGCGKGEDAASGADADNKDGQGCWNATRVESAKRIDAWIKTDPTGTQAERTLLVGDFNAYAMEDPITTLHAAGWQDALKLAKVEQPYSFVFEGQAGRLDHALISPALAAALRGAVEWHNNADESDRFGYERAGDAGPYRASDHDPLLLGFELD